MRKLLNNPRLVFPLALAAIAFGARAALPGKFDGARAAGPSQAAALQRSSLTEAAVTDAAPVSIEAALAAVKIPAEIHNPFGSSAIQPAAAAVPGHAQPDNLDTLQLSAIWTENGSTWVLINGRIQRSGDRVGRIRIESAGQDGVWVEHWKGRDFIALGETFTLATPARPSSGTL